MHSRTAFKQETSGRYFMNRRNMHIYTRPKSQAFNSRVKYQLSQNRIIINATRPVTCFGKSKQVFAQGWISRALENESK